MKVHVPFRHEELSAVELPVVWTGFGSDNTVHKKQKNTEKTAKYSANSSTHIVQDRKQSVALRHTWYLHADAITLDKQNREDKKTHTQCPTGSDWPEKLQNKTKSRHYTFGLIKRLEKLQNKTKTLLIVYIRTFGKTYTYIHSDKTRPVRVENKKNKRRNTPSPMSVHCHSRVHHQALPRQRARR